MKPPNKRISLPLNPLIQSKISDHVNVSKLILISNIDLTSIRDKFNLLSLPRDLVLISNRKRKHQILDLSLIGPHLGHLFEQLRVEGPQIIQRILLPDQSPQEEVCETRI